MRLPFISKRESELPADETTGLTPDLVIQNLYQSLGALDSEPDPANAQHLANVMFRASLQGDGPTARALIARIQTGINYLVATYGGGGTGASGT